MSSANQLLPFWYVYTTPAIAGNGNNIGNLVLQVDSQFMLESILGSCTLDATTDFAPNYFSVGVQDQGTGRNLTSGRVPQNNLIGVSRFSLYRRHPTTFAPQTTFQFDVLNLSGTSNTVTIVLQGYKIYPS